MESGKNTACLEITSDYAKFAVGYSLGGSPILLYYAKKRIPGLVNGGKIVNRAALSEVLKGFLALEDENLRLKINASNISIVVPPIGFEVYQNHKTTNVIAADSTIDRIDILNVMSLVKKEIIPSGNVIVDIVPDAFMLEDGRAFRNPPLEEKSNSITVQAKLHTLPERILNDYRRVAEEAGFRVKRSCVASYCASQLIASYKDLPESYIYVDIGARVTTVSLIGKTSPFGSLFFLQGGDDLSESIAKAFGLDFQKAQEIKEKYGYNKREPKFVLPIVKGADGDGNPKDFFQKDLNAVISEFYSKYDVVLTNAISTISGKKASSVSSIDAAPLIVSGGGSLLAGTSDLLAPVYIHRRLILFVPRVLGARDPGATNLLGLIAAEGSYKGTLEDNYHGVSTLSRGE